MAPPTRITDGKNGPSAAAEWRGYVKRALEDIATTLGEIKSAVACMDTRLGSVEIDVGKLKVKAGIWGGLAGILGAGVVIGGFVLSLLLGAWKGRLP